MLGIVDPQGPVMLNAPACCKGSWQVLQTKGHPSSILSFFFNTKDMHTTSLPSILRQKHSVGMTVRAEMEEVLCWKMLRAAINQSFDLETLPDLVKTAGSANQMARTLSAPSFSFLVLQLPLKSVRFCSLQNLNLPKTNTGRQQNADRCTISAKASFSILPLLCHFTRRQ